MASTPAVLEVKRSLLIQAPPARVLAAFIMGQGWKAALQAMKDYMDNEGVRTRGHR